MQCLNDIFIVRTYFISFRLQLEIPSLYEVASLDIYIYIYIYMCLFSASAYTRVWLALPNVSTESHAEVGQA